MYINPTSWYQLVTLGQGLIQINESNHCSFYVLQDGGSPHPMFIDSGLGLSAGAQRELFSRLNIGEYSVLGTHLHSDHVGLSANAREFWAGKIEWDQYKARDGFPLPYYLKQFGNKSNLPSDRSAQSKRSLLKPSKFVDDGEVVEFGPWQLEVVHTPGHTSGHLSFFDTARKVGFLGDMIYDGVLYLHLKDSSFRSYVASLVKLIEYLRANDLYSWTLLPCHNSIPLNPAYLLRVRDVLSRIQQGDLDPVGQTKGDGVLCESFLFVYGGIKIFIKKKDVPGIKDKANLPIVIGV